MSGCDNTGGVGETGNSAEAGSSDAPSDGTSGGTSGVSMTGGQTSVDVGEEGGGEGTPPDAGDSAGDSDDIPVDVGGAGTCDPLVQDCPDGQGCYDSGGGFDCSDTADVPAGPGDPCDAQTQCEPGSACVDGTTLNDCEGESCCAEFCNTSGDTCLGEDDCQPWPGAAAGFEDVGFCGVVPAVGDPCEPLVQDCPEGQACYGDGAGGFACGVQDGNGQDSDPCADDSACANGYSCQDGDLLPQCDAALCCVQYCDLSGPLCDQPDATCTSLPGPAPEPGFEDVGYCGV